MSSAVDNLSNTNTSTNPYSNTTISDDGRVYRYSNTSQGKAIDLNSPEGRNIIIIGSLITGTVVLVLVLPMILRVGGAVALLRAIK